MEVQRKYRAKKKLEERELSVEEQSYVNKKRRGANRERVKKCGARAKTKNNTQNGNEIVKSQTSGLSDIISVSYSSTQTLGESTRKVKNALPASPRKKEAILTHMVANLDDADKNDLVSIVTGGSTAKKKTHDEINRDIRNFFERNDISRISPETSDVEYICPETGDQILKATRHMVLSIRESYALFIDGRNMQDKEGILT